MRPGVGFLQCFDSDVSVNLGAVEPGASERLLDPTPRCCKPSRPITSKRSSCATVNLTTASVGQAVRGQTTTVTTAHVNTALMQPHWREHDHWITAPDDE